MYSLTFCVRVMSPEPLEARSPGRRSNVENASVTCWSLISNARARTPRKQGFALCCHSNATGAPIANPPNSAQLGGSLYNAPKLHPGLCSSVGVWPRTDRQTDTQTHVTTIHFALSTSHAKCNNNTQCFDTVGWVTGKASGL